MRLRKIEISVMVDFGDQNYKAKGFRRKFQAYLDPIIAQATAVFGLAISPADEELSIEVKGAYMTSMEACYDVENATLEDALLISDHMVKGMFDAVEGYGLITAAILGEIRITGSYRVLDGVPEHD